MDKNKKVEGVKTLDSKQKLKPEFVGMQFYHADLHQHETIEGEAIQPFIKKYSNKEGYTHFFEKEEI